MKSKFCLALCLALCLAPAASGQGARPGDFKVSEIKEGALKTLREESAGRGRALLVNFWATWCAPCREEFPDLVRVRARYGADRLDFVTVSLDDPSDIGTAVPAFLREVRATHIPAYLLNADDPEAVISLFDPTWRGELPATFLYDARGRLVYTHRGRIKPPELHKAIDEALAAKPDAPPTEANMKTNDDLARLLAYDASAPLNLKTVGTKSDGGVVVEDVTFEGAGEIVEAYVVRPEAGTGPFAGALFVHWFEPPNPTSNRTQFLEEARALARRGVVSVLPSTFWSDPARYKARRWQTDFDNSVAQAKRLRRALDVLLSRAGVDARRVAYVGHDYGAMFGALIAGVETRPKAYALIAGTSRFADWYLFGSSTGVPAGEDLARFREQLSRIDPVTALPRARGSFFLQFGEDDKYTPRDNFLAFYAAAPAPKRIATYASGHAMTADIIRHDRTAWLAEQLDLK